MKLVKKSKRKRYYHTENCLAVQTNGREKYIDVEEMDTLIDVDWLDHCGHCKGVDETNQDRSTYLKLKEIGETA